MTWKKKFLNYINNFWYKTKFWFTCLFYGLKKADTEILSNSNDDYIIDRDKQLSLVRILLRR